MNPTPFLCLTLLWMGLPGSAQDEDARSLLLQARALQRRCGGDDPEGAVRLYQRALTLEPQSAELHLRLSEALVETNDIQRAVVHARRATELAPRHGEAWAQLGILQSWRGGVNPAALEEAQQALQRATRLSPMDIELWARLAEVATQRRDERVALKAWIRVGRLHPPYLIQGRSLETLAWERVLDLTDRLTNEEARYEALMALCQAPKPNPIHLRHLETLSRTFVDRGLLSKAEDGFACLARHYANEPILWENMALLKIRARRYAEALETLDRAEALRVSPRTQYHRGLALMFLGRFADAEACWRNLPTFQDIHGDTLLLGRIHELRLMALLLDDRARDAAALPLPEGRSNPTPLAQALHLQALVRLEAWKELLTALPKTHALSPRPGILAHLSEDHLKQLMAAKNLDAPLRKVLHKAELETTAALQAEFHQWSPCLATLEKRRALGPFENVGPLLVASNALQRLGRPSEALEKLREAQRMNPDHPGLQNDLGYLLLELNQDLSEAATLIEAALKQSPDNPAVLDSWGWALCKQKRYAEAEPYLRKAATLEPLDPEIQQHLAEALLALGRKTEALEAWERALAFEVPNRLELEQRVQRLRLELLRDPEEEQDAPLPPSETDETESFSEVP